MFLTTSFVHLRYLPFIYYLLLVSYSFYLFIACLFTFLLLASLDALHFSCLDLFIAPS